MNSENVELEICLRGGPGSGKTQVMQIIADALGKHGIHVECYMGKRRKRLMGPPGVDCSGPFDQRRIAVFEEWGKRVPIYPPNA